MKSSSTVPQTLRVLGEMPGPLSDAGLSDETLEMPAPERKRSSYPSDTDSAESFMPDTDGKRKSRRAEKAKPPIKTSKVHRKVNTNRMRRHRLTKLEAKDPDKFSALKMIAEFKDRVIPGAKCNPCTKRKRDETDDVAGLVDQPQAEGKQARHDYVKSDRKRKHWEITVGSDCSGLGTDVAAVKRACQKHDIGVRCKFISERDEATRQMHSFFSDHHGVKPEAKYSDVKKSLQPQNHDIDLYITGPPCQSWSGAGSGGGIDDKRGLVFFDVCKFITTARPKAFIIENVLGLPKKHPKELGKALKLFTRANYQISWSPINALKCACPQSRPRIYIVGLRSDCCCYKFSWPQDLSATPPVDMFLDADEQKQIPRFNKTELRNYTIWNKKVKKMGNDLKASTFIMDLGAGKSFAQCMQDKSPCITRTRGGSGGFFISNQNRYMNLHEIGRLQGFTTKEVDAIIESGASEKQIGAAFGNAMNKMVLDRLVPKVIWAAGLCDEKMEDPWKKFSWRGRAGKMPDINHYS